MNVDVLKHLVEQYITPNPLRAISETAKHIADALDIAPVQAHLGNPTGPLYAPAIDAMIKSLEERKHSSESDGYTGGYDNHAGNLELRKRAAAAITKIDGLPEGAINMGNTFACNAGTGGLNAVFAITQPGSVIYAPKPTYPAWKRIAERYGLKIVQYDLKPDNHFLPDTKQLKQLIDTHSPHGPKGGTNIVLYHYPSNPTGATLTDAQAKQVAETMGEVVRHQPNTMLVQEDIYIATTHPEDAIVTPTKHFDRDTLDHLVLIHSMSKAGHPQERTGVIAVPNRDIATYVSGALSFLTLGSSSTDFVGITETLEHIANGGLEKRSESRDPGNYRYKLARYYQERMSAVSKGLCEMEDKLRKAGLMDKAPPILQEVNPGLQTEPGKEYQKRTPRGTYYLFPDFEFLRGKKIPAALLEAPAFTEKLTDIRKKRDESLEVEPTIQSADDLALILANAHYLGFRPVTVAPGTLFNGEKSMHLRISAVDPDIKAMKDITHSISGITQEILGVPLGVKRHSANSTDIAALKAEPSMFRAFLAKLREAFNPQQGRER